MVSKKEDLTLNEYQRKAMSTCMKSCDNHTYMLMGFVGEVGELFSKLAKSVRKQNIECMYNKFTADNWTEQDEHDLKSELGDCAWFIAGIAHSMGWTLQDVCQENLDKLASRKQRGVIDGNGDNR